MATTMSELAARERGVGLRRTAQRRPEWRERPAAEVPAIEIRLAAAPDAGAVRRLAILDEQPALEGRALVALLDGAVVAALSLHDGRVVADPFVLTRSVVGLLRQRAQDLTSQAPVRHRLVRHAGLRVA
jgi:hypothetical protein